MTEAARWRRMFSSEAAPKGGISVCSAGTCNEIKFSACVRESKAVGGNPQGV